MRKYLILLMMFVVFACTQDCLNCGESDKKSNEDSNLEKRLTTLQDVVDNANAGEEIDLSDYELTSYTATVNKKLTIKNGSLKNATLIITSENVKLEKLTDLSVATSSSRLTINDSKLSDLLIGNATSESRATAVDIAIAMVSVAGCEIENVELNGFNSQLNITDVKTKINDIMTSTKVKVILEAGSYEGMKDPVVENNGELTRIDMTKEKTLSVLSIHSHPTKAEYQIDEKLDTTGLIVMGTYTASVEIFKSGGWKGEAVDSVTKWEDEKDYTITCEDFSTAGVKIVTITSNVDTKVKCNFYVYVKDAQIKEPEITDITLKSLGEPKTLYRVGEKLDLSWVQLVGTYNGLEINLPYTSEPVNGGQLTTENTQITFYYNGEIISTKEITVTEPCEVEFYDGIGESSLLYMLEMADGESLRLPVDPQRGNYTFAGWYNGDEKIESGYKVTSTLKLTARWNTKNYTVIFYANDTSDKIIKQTFVLDVEQALMKNSFIREGYTFVGWAKNGFGEKVYDDCAIVKNLTDKVNDEVTLYAKWDVNTYTVKFNANGGSGEMADMSFNYNEEKALTVNTFTRKDYTFAGWATSADGDVIYADEQNVKNLTAENKATVTLYAVWTEKDKVLSVRFSMPSETAIDCGSSVTLLCNTEGAKISYTIDGVTKEYSDAIVITEDVTITAFATKDGMKNSDTTTASYTVKTYTVTYKSDYDTVPSDVVGLKKDDKLTAEQLPELTRTGYTFAGWYNGENEVTTEYKITNDLELTAQWDVNTYAITYNLNDGTNAESNPTSYTVETETITLADASKEGYVFAGWYTDEAFKEENKVTQIATNSPNNVILYAKWTINTYTITYNLNGGTNAESNPTSYTVETETITLADASKEGYVFAGWYTDEAFKEENKVTLIATSSPNNVILYAKWTINTYTITYNLNGGTNAESNPTSYIVETETITLKNAIKKGAAFCGWYTDGSFTNPITEIVKGSTKDITLYAKWRDAVVGDIAYSDGSVSENCDNTKIPVGIVITVTNGVATKIVSLTQGRKPWSEASTWCSNYTDESGNSNWNFPDKGTVNYLHNIDDKVNAAIVKIKDITKVELLSGIYWSSETYSSGRAYGVDFDKSYIGTFSNTDYYNVRAVRDF